MNMLFRAGFAALVAMLLPCAAVAQSNPVALPAGYAPLSSMGFGSLGGSVTPVDPTHPLPVDTVAKSTATDRGAVVGTSAVTLMAANTSRRGMAIQNQSASATCYISGQATATADYHSLMIPAGGYYETSPTHTGTGAISAICSAASTSLYAREW